MSHSRIDASLNLPREEIDHEIQQLRDLIGRNEVFNEKSRLGRRITYNSPMENIVLQLLFEIRELRIQFTGQSRDEPASLREPNKVSRSFHDHALDLTYGRSTQDIFLVRNRRGSTVSLLNIKEARNMICEIDGTSKNRVREFLNANMQ